MKKTRLWSKKQNQSKPIKANHRGMLEFLGYAKYYFEKLSYENENY